MVGLLSIIGNWVNNTPQVMLLQFSPSHIASPVLPEIKHVLKKQKQKQKRQGKKRKKVEFNSRQSCSTLVQAIIAETNKK